MIKDFTPSRTNLTSGVVVKQHTLERSVYKPVLPTFSDVTLSGSVKSFPRGYNTGSGDVSQQNYESGSSIYRVDGGTVGIFERYNGLSSYPSGSEGDGPNNRFDLTQSWDEDSPSIVGDPKYRRDDQREFYNGEFSQSSHVKIQRGLNFGDDDPCYPYTNWENVPELLYRLEFLSGSDELYRIETYTPPEPVTLNEFERSNYNLTYPTCSNIRGLLIELTESNCINNTVGDSCLNTSTESFWFVENSITNILVGSKAYSDSDGEGVFNGTNSQSIPLWWGVKPSGSIFNTKSLKIDSTGSVIEVRPCRGPADNVYYFQSSSYQEPCYSYTIMNFHDPEGQSDVYWTYYTCSTGLQVTEAIPFGFATRCLANSNQTASAGLVTGGTVTCGTSTGTVTLIASASSSELVNTEQLLTEYTLQNNPGCWFYYSGSVNPIGEVPLNSVTGTCGGPPPPTTVPITLGFSQYSSNNACDSSGTTVYYADNSQLHLATTIYDDSAGTITATTGFYSDGVVVRYMNNGILGAIVSCTGGGTGIGLGGANDGDGNASNDINPYLGNSL